MKRIICILLVFCLVALFVACTPKDNGGDKPDQGENNNNEPDNGNNENNENNENNGNNENNENNNGGGDNTPPAGEEPKLTFAALNALLAASDNYTMTFHFRDMTGTENVTITAKTEGNKRALEGNGVVQYAVLGDGIVTVYTATEEGYRQTEHLATEWEEFISSEDLDTILNQENYVADGDKYRLKDAALLEGFTAFALTLTADGCVFDASTVYEDATVSAQITLNQIGTTCVTLPTEG